MGQKNKIARRWARRGTRPRAPHDQRTSSVYIFGAICPQEGKGAALVLPRCDTQAMSLHLAEVAQAVAPGAHGVMLMDRAGWHRAKDLVVPDNLTLVLLPARAPELNPVENIWQFLRDNWLSSRVFASYARHRRSLLRRVEPPHRPALDHHVHRPPRLGQCMMINAGWYKNRPVTWKVGGQGSCPSDCLPVLGSPATRGVRQGFFASDLRACGTPSPERPSRTHDQVRLAQVLIGGSLSTPPILGPKAACVTPSGPPSLSCLCPRSSASRFRARLTRLLIVPTLVPHTSAVSS